MNQIFIREFRVEAWVGIYEWEILRPQTIEIDLEIGVREPGVGKSAGASDDIKDTIHYGEVVERFRKELAGRKFKLLEALAEDLAAIVLNEFGAQWTKISVAKLGHIRGVKKVGVSIARGDVVK